jgi:hypothetical protein
VSEQRASLAAQLEYELKRDFKGVLKRFQVQAKDAQTEEKERDREEGEYLKKEEQLINAVRDAKEKTNSLQKDRSAAAASVKGHQGAKSAVTAERAGLEKKLSGEEILIERQRSQLHEILQSAQVDEVAFTYVYMCIW